MNIEGTHGQKLNVPNGRWIKVGDFLPEEDTSVLVFFNGEVMTIGCFNEGGWKILPNDGWFTGGFLEEGENVEVTHWMNLPAYPVDVLECSSD